MKKLMTFGIASFVFAATMSVASASNNNNWYGGHHSSSEPEVTISNLNEGHIMNDTKTVSSTGKNAASSFGWFGGGAAINTGSATAETWVVNQVGSNETEIDDAEGSVAVGNSNIGGIYNRTKTFAGTGKNHAYASGGVARITTGDALSFSDIMNVIGFNSTDIEN